MRNVQPAFRKNRGTELKRKQKAETMKSLLKRTGIAAGALLAIAMLNGCALTEGHVGMSYVPQAGVARVEGAEHVALKVEVLDERAVKDKVGAKKNGYGMEMAPILSTNDVADVLKCAIETELNQRGFAVGSGPVAVIAELSKFYCDFKLGFWSGTAVAEATMNVQVRNPDGTIAYSKLVAGEGIKPRIQLASEGNAQMALHAALQDAVAKLFADPSFIDALIKSGTQGGPPTARAN